jgi:LytS/YehU family sensor histidine kinase
MMVNSLHLPGISQHSGAVRTVCTSNGAVLYDVMMEGAGIKLELVSHRVEKRYGNAKEYR